MRKLPIGIDDFKELREQNYFYADKSLWIHHLLEDGAKVTLFTRPRRFGKTLNMSMLHYFFDVKNSEENRNLFNGLKIEKSMHILEQGKFPTIFISFKDLRLNSWEECLIKVINLLLRCFLEHEDLYNSLSKMKKIRYDLFINRSADAAWDDALKVLSEYLEAYYQKKVVILIDEYDTPLIYAYQYGYYDKAVSFFRNLYSAALKSNTSLHKGIMTGITRVAKEGIFSGLSNLTVDTILSTKYADFFGITEDELQSAVEEYQIPDSIGDIRKWYNGYRFGNVEIYNPWSILNYLKTGQLSAYWINTSANTEINQILDISDESVFLDLDKLLAGNTLTKYIYKEMTFESLRDQKKLWTLLLNSGYLTVTDTSSQDGYYRLRIPNQEILSFFKENFIERFIGLDNAHLPQLLKSLKSKTITGKNSFESALKSIFLSKISYFDAAGRESFYHGFMICLSLLFQSEYIAISNIESGSGRPDLVLEPRDKKNPGIILEFKIAGNKKELEQAAESALAQIENEKYSAFLQERGVEDILAIGIAFCGKELCIKRRI
ncbi:MAG: ATP-binding protein [Fusobacteriaceae bacterium]|jgi:hypothetical protein|nr:ATP-binding protein [Fusobacteriaceae bacterium]